MHSMKTRKERFLGRLGANVISKQQVEDDLHTKHDVAVFAGLEEAVSKIKKEVFDVENNLLILDSIKMHLETEEGKTKLPLGSNATTAEDMRNAVSGVLPDFATLHRCDERTLRSVLHFLYMNGVQAASISSRPALPSKAGKVLAKAAWRACKVDGCATALAVA
jgi:hypothetical protein